jgi:hypothetical protein
MLYGKLPYKEMTSINDIDNLKSTEELEIPFQVPVSEDTK